jgi:hypothetical protein
MNFKVTKMVTDEQAIRNPIIAAHVAAWDTGNYDSTNVRRVVGIGVNADIVAIRFADGNMTMVAVHTYHRHRRSIRRFNRVSD